MFYSNDLFKLSGAFSNLWYSIIYIYIYNVTCRLFMMIYWLNNFAKLDVQWNTLCYSNVVLLDSSTFLNLSILVHQDFDRLTSIDLISFQERLSLSATDMLRVVWSLRYTDLIPICFMKRRTLARNSAWFFVKRVTFMRI